jgi:hypothetical protein
MKTRFVWLAALLVAGCNLQLGGLGTPTPTRTPTPTGTPTPTRTPTPTGSIAPLADDAVVLSFESASHCARGNCYTASSFRVDGRFDAADETDKRKRSGKIDPALVLALRREIAKADFKALRVDANKRCKSLIDGSAQTWVFTTGDGKETVKTCSADFESGAVFEAGLKLLTAADEAQKRETSPTPEPSLTPVPAGRSPFRGVWTVADDPAVKGPITQDSCAKFRRWVFSPAADGTEGVQVAVTDANVQARSSLSLCFWGHLVVGSAAKRGTTPAQAPQGWRRHAIQRAGHMSRI